MACEAAAAGGKRCTCDFVRESGPQIAALHWVTMRRFGSVPIKVQVPCRKCGAKRAPGVAGCWLDPNIIEQILPNQKAIGDAVERYAAG